MLEKKDYMYQASEARCKELEYFILELSESDDYILSKLNDLKISKITEEN